VRPIAKPAYAHPGPRTERDSPLHRGAHDTGERHGRLGEWVSGPGAFVRWLQAAAAQKPPHLPPDRVEHLRHLRRSH
jgi:hypothetical protein